MKNSMNKKMSAAMKGGTVNGTSNFVGKTGAFIKKWRKPALSVGLQMLFIFALSAIPGLAQNPWGGSGTSKLANAGSNTIVVLTWISLFIAIVAAISIGVCVYFEMNYKKNIIVALFGLGGFAILGSVAYDIVNLNSITMSNPTLGN